MRDGADWVINGAKRFASGASPRPTRSCSRAPPASRAAARNHRVHRPTRHARDEIPYFHWTFNMPTDHAEVVLRDLRVPRDAILGEEGRGLETALFFVHENRIRQAAASVGAADYCVTRERRVRQAADHVRQAAVGAPGDPVAARRARDRRPAAAHVRARDRRGDGLGRSHRRSQRPRLDVQLPRQPARVRRRRPRDAGPRRASATRASPFEHIYRHHRRYRITEGSEEIQIRNVAGHLFGFVRR